MTLKNNALVITYMNHPVCPRSSVTFLLKFSLIVNLSFEERVILSHISLFQYFHASHTSQDSKNLGFYTTQDLETGHARFRCYQV